jgi:hypothetical protein
MSIFKKLFGATSKPRTMLDDAQETGGKLVIKGYRRIAAKHGCAPTSKTPDQKIMEIYSKVGTAFQEASERRGEHIPALFKNHIVLKFFQVYELSGDQFMQEHLQYEVNKYLREGLRPDYMRELALFDPDGNDPDVKRLREIQRSTREQLERQFLPKEQQPTPLSDLPTVNIGSFKYADDIPYQQIADKVVRFSVVASGQCKEIAEKATFSQINDVKHESLLREVVAYHISVAIANVMVKKNLLGRNNYKQIESGICNAIDSILRKPGENLERYLPIIDMDNRSKAQMYFSKDAHGLQVSDEQINWYAERYDRPVIKDIPADQMAIVYYTMRIARLLATGQDIDKFIVHYVNNVLPDRALELQDEVCKCLT